MEDMLKASVIKKLKYLIISILCCSVVIH